MTATLWAPLLIVALAISAVAAKPEKVKRPKTPPPAAGLTEVLQPFDKNADGHIDAGELTALQETYSNLAKLDKDASGQIEQAEVPAPAPVKGKAERTRGHRFTGFREADKNGNHKIDTDEVEGLQKALMASGSDLMAKIDRNKNGKLDSDEVSRINERLEKGRSAKGKRPAAAPTKTSAPPTTPPSKPAEIAKPSEAAKPAETVRPAEKVELPESANSDATKKPAEKNCL